MRTFLLLCSLAAALPALADNKNLPLPSFEPPPPAVTAAPAQEAPRPFTTGT